MATYFDEINKNISSIVIDAVIDYLSSQEIDLSNIDPADIAAHLGTKYKGSAKASSKTSGGSASTSATPSDPDALCTYIPTRGAKCEANEMCGRKATGLSCESDPRCKLHSGKPGKVADGTKSKSTTASKAAPKSTAKAAASASKVVTRAPPPSAPPRRDANIGSLRPISGYDKNFMYDAKTNIVVDTNLKQVVGMYIDKEVKYYVPEDRRAEFKYTSFTFADDLPYEEQEQEQEQEEQPEEGETQDDGEEGETQEDEGEPQDESEVQPEPDPEPVKKSVPAPVKRPSLPAKRP